MTGSTSILLSLNNGERRPASSEQQLKITKNLTLSVTRRRRIAESRTGAWKVVRQQGNGRAEHQSGRCRNSFRRRTKMVSTQAGRAPSNREIKVIAGLFIISALCLSSLASAQDRD